MQKEGKLGIDDALQFREKYTLHRVYIFSLSQLVGPTKEWDPLIVRKEKHIPDVGYNFSQFS